MCICRLLEIRRQVGKHWVSSVLTFRGAPMTEEGMTVPGIESSGSREAGISLLLALILVFLFSLLGLYVALDAAADVHVSSNYEGEIQARYAALAGIEHARTLLKGLDFDDLLNGPDGTHDNDSSYMVLAGSHSFRNPVDWTLARALDMDDPAIDLAGAPDDGLMNTGACMSAPGKILIPATGIPFASTVFSGTGSRTAARYFVKITDNNGEAPEVAGDPSNNPFVDGDGLIICRSLGVAPIIREKTGSFVHRNSVAVVEARFKRLRTFDLSVPLLLNSARVLPAGSMMFVGDSFEIGGGAAEPGVGVLDADAADGIDPATDITLRLAPAQNDNIQGAGLTPSVRNLTAVIGSNPDKALLFDKNFLWDFSRNKTRLFADVVYQGNQSWTDGAVPDLGAYDPQLPYNGAGQRPRATLVDGDLSITGNLSGGGMLVVTGRLSISGRFTFNGLLLIIGAGELDAGGADVILSGGIYLAALAQSAGSLSWTPAHLSLGGSSRLIFNRQAIRMAISLMPAAQTGFREVTRSLDP